MSIVSFQVCEQYFLHEGERMISLYNPEAENRYFICMWLWYVAMVHKWLFLFSLKKTEKNMILILILIGKKKIDYIFLKGALELNNGMLQKYGGIEL